MNEIRNMTIEEVEAVSGGDACSTAFEWSFGTIGASLGFIFGGAGAFAGAGVGYSVGSILAEGVCS